MATFAFTDRFPVTLDVSRGVRKSFLRVSRTVGSDKVDGVVSVPSVSASEMGYMYLSGTDG
jgi:hypothetical protein